MFHTPADTIGFVGLELTAGRYGFEGSSRFFTPANSMSNPALAMIVGPVKHRAYFSAGPNSPSLMRSAAAIEPSI